MLPHSEASYTKKVTEVLMLEYRKRFCQDVCCFLVCTTMDQLNNSFIYKLSNEMIACVYVLGSPMNRGVSCNVNCGFVVTIQNGCTVMLNTNVTQ